jgi:hypothetical protein
MPSLKPDDKILLNHVHSGKTLEEIARIQKKPVGNIESRLKTIAASLYFKDHLPYEKVEEITGIKKDAIVIKPVVKSLSYSQKDSIDMALLEPESISSPEPKPISLVIPIQIISTDNPFTLDAISTLLISTLTRGLFTTTSIS